MDPRDRVRNYPMRTCKLLIGANLALLAGAGLLGCGGSSDDPVSQKAFVGSWIEITSQRSSAGSMMIGPAREELRELVFNADGSFRLTVCDSSGVPVEPAEYVAGKWRIEDQRIVFEITDDALGETHQGWSPAQFIGLVMESETVPADMLQLRDAGHARVRFARLGAAEAE